MSSPVVRWCLALVLLASGCASDLLVSAPSALPPLSGTPLGKLAPLSIAVGEVRGAGGVDAVVGRRGGALLQPEGPIQLTEDVGTIVRRVVTQTLERAGHRVVADGGDVFLGPRVEEFTVAAPRAGFGWEVTARVRLVLRVSPRPGDETWDEIASSAERSRYTFWRPGLSTLEPVLRGCLDDLAELLAQREELAAALSRNAGIAR